MKGRLNQSGNDYANNRWKCKNEQRQLYSCLTSGIDLKRPVIIRSIKNAVLCCGWKEIFHTEMEALTEITCERELQV